MKKFLTGLLVLCFSSSIAFSLDFGLLIDQKFELENEFLSYSPGLIPWLSWDGGSGLSFYLSGALSFKYKRYDDGIDNNDGWSDPALLPELSRFALSYRPNQNLGLEVGRVVYTDALGFAANGLFDGLRVEAGLPYGVITGGLWYTGLLYKETAKIMMSDADMKNYAEPWDWDNMDAYFASRRLLAAVRWDMPFLEFHTLSLEALAQFDLNAETRLHSQYLEAEAALFPAGKLGLNAGVLFEALEDGEGEFAAALGARLRLRMDLPGFLNDSLAVTMKFTSGQWNDTFTAFTPLSSPTQGDIFPGTLSGLALFSVDYAARFHRTLLLESVLRYFIRTWDDPASPGSLYGGELWASLAWQPLDDLRLSLGGGVFLPGLGNIDPGSGNDPQWKFAVGLTLSF
jgi:hypothetical protein